MPTDIPDSLKGIVLTPKGKIPQRDTVLLRGTEEWEFCNDPVRRQILKILRKGIEDNITSESFNEETGEKVIRQKIIKRKALSVVEIVKHSEKIDPSEVLSKNQVYHHLPKLIEGEYVIKYGTVTTGKRTTDYYRRTAEGFMCFETPKIIDPKKLKEKMEKGINGFDFKLSSKDQKKLADLLAQLELQRMKDAEKITDKVIGDVIDKHKTSMIDFLMWIRASGDPEFQSTLDQIRALIP
ncbi:MAG: hypothetical protein ACW976_01675 [Candidatus Ranarchaeia archaeon]|jgi:DNA-binding transcriptional ArsR family regulator